MKKNRLNLKFLSIILILAMILINLGVNLSISHQLIYTEDSRSNEIVSLNKTNFNFTVIPMDLDEIDRIHPLGHLVAPSHMFPTDHIYLELKNASKIIPVYMPADGVVLSIRKSGENDYDITLEFASNKLRVNFGHMSGINYTLFGPLDFTSCDKVNVNKNVNAGTKIGTIGGPNMNGVCLDFTLYDFNVYLTGFINPQFYNDQVHTVCPLDYYIDPLQQQLLNKVYWIGAEPPNCGRIDFDQPGKLVGNWFLKSWNVNMMDDWVFVCPNLLSFVYYNINLSEVRISIGGNLINKGNNGSMICFVEENSPDPANVSVETGKVAYHLILDTCPRKTLNQTLLVQLISENELKVELFNGTYSADEINFTANAKIYDRGSNSTQETKKISWDFIPLALFILLIINILMIIKKRNEKLKWNCLK